MSLRVGVWTLLLLTLLLQGCAALRGPDPADPLEPLNRKITMINDAADTMLLRPVAVIYGEALPSFVRTGIGNLFGNQSDVWSALNSLAQFKVRAASQNAMRVGINTFFGFGGLIDFASDWRIQKQKEDFGQTLAYWGVPAGPYVVLPLFGPSTLRDSLATSIDYRGDLTRQFHDRATRNSMTLLRLTDTRERYLKLVDAVRQAALDPYTFTRDAYLQKRLNDVYDGNPPMRDDYDDFEDKPEDKIELKPEPSKKP